MNDTLTWPGYVNLGDTNLASLKLTTDQCGSYGINAPLTANPDYSAYGLNSYEEARLGIDPQTFKDAIQRAVQEILKENPDRLEWPEWDKEDEVCEKVPERYKKKYRE